MKIVRPLLLSLLLVAFSASAKEKPLPSPWQPFSALNALLLNEDLADFDFSGQASPPSCSGSVVNFGQADTAKAVLMTNGHCVGMLDIAPDTIIRDQPYKVSVRLFKDKTHTINVSSTKIIYGIIKTHDVALVELDATYKALNEQGVRSRRIASKALPVGATLIMPSGFFRRTTSCAILDIVPFIKEDVYLNTDAYKYRECLAMHGTSGSPLIDAASGEVVGVNYTGNDDGERCTFNNPCEVDTAGHITVDKGAGYGDPVHQIMNCLNADHLFDLNQPTCTLPR